MPRPTHPGGGAFRFWTTRPACLHRRRCRRMPFAISWAIRGSPLHRPSGNGDNSRPPLPAHRPPPASEATPGIGTETENQPTQQTRKIEPVESSRPTERVEATSPQMRQGLHPRPAHRPAKRCRELATHQKPVAPATEPEKSSERDADDPPRRARRPSRTRWYGDQAE